jgi:hypothetical protein
MTTIFMVYPPLPNEAATPGRIVRNFPHPGNKKSVGFVPLDSALFRCSRFMRREKYRVCGLHGDDEPRPTW